MCGAKRPKAKKKVQSANELARRLGEYGGNILALVDALPETETRRHIRDQLLRSGTAPGAHYAEARSAQSRKDFVHKISLASKEMRESLYWVRVAINSDLVENDFPELLTETRALVAMLFSSVQTARNTEE